MSVFVIPFPQGQPSERRWRQVKWRVTMPVSPHHPIGFEQVGSVQTGCLHSVDPGPHRTSWVMSYGDARGRVKS